MNDLMIKVSMPWWQQNTHENVCISRDDLYVRLGTRPYIDSYFKMVTTMHLGPYD